MQAGEASATARRVAAYRLLFDRAGAPYGDAAADERLARDVAGDVAVDPAGSMVRYLTARTWFFDRVVVAALDRGIGQVVVAAAGYDGRALRYAKPGVRWFEVDHPDTQRDKRARLDRLGIDTGHIAFVPADFTVDRVDEALAAAGHEPSQPSLLTVEGVAAYLELDVLTSLLGELRSAAADGSTLAISVSTGAPADRRAAFAAAVQAMGEPVRSTLRAEEAAPFLARTGWAALDADAGSQAVAAGLLVCTPSLGWRT